MTTYDESISGDLSSNRLAPFSFALTPGDNMLTASQSASDDDFVTITIPAGETLLQIVVVSYSDTDRAFIAVDDGAVFGEDPANPNPANLLGGAHYRNTHVGSDILDDMGNSAALGFPGFTPPLTQATYTFWLNQTEDTSTVTLNFIVSSSGPTNGDDSLTGGAGADTIDALGGDDTVAGAGGDDSLSGDDGADVVSGGAGFDAVNGGEGSDSLNGGGDADTMHGEGGDDTMSGSVGDDTMGGEGGRDVMMGDDGADTLHGFGSHDTVLGGDGNDDLRGGFGKDLLNGSADNDVLRGFEGDDRLFGGGGVDTLLGGDENDSLIGGGGGDRLKGDAGDDSLNGSFGADLVTGGLGNDEFQFRKTHAVDTIDDFVAGVGTDDVIRLLAFGAAFDSFGEVMAAASDNGTDTTIDFGGGDMLVLEGVLVGQLDASDFIFG